MFFRLYILIEKNNFNQTKNLGIYDYNTALEKKIAYESISIDNIYTIDGPFEYSHNFTQNPNSILEPLNKNFAIDSPKLTNKIKKVNLLPPINDITFKKTNFFD
jgi:hypothetical protein